MQRSGVLDPDPTDSKCVSRLRMWLYDSDCQHRSDLGDGPVRRNALVRVAGDSVVVGSPVVGFGEREVLVAVDFFRA